MLKTNSIRRKKISQNPKVLLVGCLPNSSKLNLFLNYEKCQHHQDRHRLGQQPAMGIQLNTLKFLHKDRIIYLDIWNVTIPYERYRQLAPIYWDNVQAVVGVCSMSNESSYYRMQYWLNKFREQNPNHSCCQVYILACEQHHNNDHNNNTSISQCFLQPIPNIPRQLLIDYSCHINAKIYIIRLRCKGRDLTKFFDDFLANFYPTGKKQSKWIKIIKSLKDRFVNV